MNYTEEQEDFYQAIARITRNQDRLNLDLLLATIDQSEDAAWAESLAGWIIRESCDSEGRSPALTWLISTLASFKVDTYAFALLNKALALVTATARGAV